VRGGLFFERLTRVKVCLNPSFAAFAAFLCNFLFLRVFVVNIPL
jgi:hypothetical protein